MRTRLTYFIGHGQKLALRWPKLSGFLCGGALTLALPPIGLWPLVIIIFPVLYQLGVPAMQRGARAVFGLGWSFGFGFFLFGLYWMGSAFLVEAETYFWLMPFAVTLLPAGLAIFYGMALFWAQVSRRFCAQNEFAQIVLFIIFIALAEYMRGHVLTGLPWNLIGMASLRLAAACPDGCGLGRIWFGCLGFAYLASCRFYGTDIRLWPGLALCFLVLLAHGMLRGYAA